MGGRQNFVTRNSRRPIENGKFLDVLANSALGLADVYNLLPEYIVEATEVHEFQSRLHELITETAQDGLSRWENLLSPRLLLFNHPLRDTRSWEGSHRRVQEELVKTGNTISACTSWLKFAG